MQKENYNNKKLVIDIIVMFILAKIILVGIYILATTMYSHEIKMNTWDANWYISIIENGYNLPPKIGANGGQANWAFFPLYPMIVFIFKGLFNVSSGTAGIIVSNICTLILAYIGARYIHKTRGSNTSVQMFLVLLFIGPYSIYLSVTYTEALFMLLSICSLYYMKEQKWLVAGLVAMFASATRVTGVVLLIPLIINIYNSYYDKISISNCRAFVVAMCKNPKLILSCMLVPGGIFTYMYYLYFKVGDAFAFKNVQIGWGRENNIIDALKRLVLGMTGMDGVRQFYLAWVIILMFMVVVYLLTQRKYDEALYIFILLMIPLLSSLDSIPRYGFGSVLLLIGINDIYERYLKDTIIVVPTLLIWGMITTLLWFSGNNVMI